MVPVRTTPAFAGTEYVIVPVFAPAEPDVIMIHDTSAAAAQLQAAVLFTVVLKVPPPAGTDCDIGEIAYEHDAVGFVGDELWPQPDVITSSSAPNVYQILIKTSLDTSEGLQPAITLPSRFRRLDQLVKLRRAEYSFG